MMGSETSLPRLAVMYEPGAFSPFEIRDAANGLCELVWVTGWSAPLTGAMERLLPRLGEMLPAEGLDHDDTVSALRQTGVDGIIVFTDLGQEPAAALASALGLPFHSPQTARRLRDKLAQRDALRAGGLPVPAALPVCSGSVSSRAEAEDLAMSWPAVLKPRRSSGGRETFLVSCPEALVAILDDVPEDEQFILEEYLPDRPDQSDAPVADMVSVELVVADGISRHVAISGRFPIVAPLRENGGFLPSHLDVEESAAVVEAAKQAAACTSRSSRRRPARGSSRSTVASAGSCRRCWRASAARHCSSGRFASPWASTSRRSSRSSRGRGSRSTTRGCRRSETSWCVTSSASRRCARSRGSSGRGSIVTPGIG
jgi:hypothetical protein